MIELVIQINIHKILDKTFFKMALEWVDDSDTILFSLSTITTIETIYSMLRKCSHVVST